jgi:hypothetical protein
VLGLLGIEEFELTRVIGEGSARGKGGEADTYLRGILQPELLAKLVAISGKPIKEIMLGLRESTAIEPDDVILAAWEQRLTSEGMPAELSADTMGLPMKFRRAYRLAYKKALADGITRPVTSDIYERIERDRSKLGLKKGDDAVKYYVEDSRGLQSTGIAPVINFEDGLGLEIPAGVDGGGDPQNTQVVTETDLRDQIFRALSPLDQREREVVKARFGLDGKGSKSLDEVGIKLDPKVGKERVRQIEARALAKLRSPWNDVGLRSFAVEPSASADKIPRQLTLRELEMRRGYAILRKQNADEERRDYSESFSEFLKSRRYRNHLSDVAYMLGETQLEYGSIDERRTGGSSGFSYAQTRLVGIIDRAVDRAGFTQDTGVRLDAVKSALDPNSAWVDELIDAVRLSVVEDRTRNRSARDSGHRAGILAYRTIKSGVTRRLYATRREIG